MYANKTGFRIRKCIFMQQIVLKAAAERANILCIL